MDSPTRPSSWSACWSFDENRATPTPRGWLRRFTYLCLDQRYSAVVLLRLTQYHYDRGQRNRSRIAGRMNSVLNGIEASPRAQIGLGVIFNGGRVVIGGETNIGQNAHLFTNVNFGLRAGGYPTVGDRVTVFANAVITGNIAIGDEAVVGPNSVVRSDVAARTVVAGTPAAPIRTRRPPVDPTRQFGEPGSEQG
tara:strand:- start:9332 stop:9913 length:582 start_codon:yes stop_codon:yes gene_type:complete